MNRAHLFGVTALIFFLSPSAFAAEGRIIPGAELHDGFFLRFQLGAGALSIENGDETPSIMEGGTGSVNLQIGGALVDNLILYGELFVNGATAPTYKRGAVIMQSSDRVSLNVGGVGLGLSYYFGDSFFTGASLRAESMNVEVDQEEKLAEAEDGAGIALQFGKEWWVSSNWGLGVAVEGHLGHVSSARDDWSVRSGAIYFSATFN